ncbi:MAG TPA: type I-E CRISPR-associated protein Cse2/CasB [Methanocorpusculum sp.]|nr:type I-E CRISPR-associated protein Cse2/CasB [Methanocorpusculum sp.]HJK25508.1 type I-E CRISPR-associated protein Cse2/CasB [Methanocorpusculum sp.]HJK26727.1 type I-E CRISPR-associated protein Cse2/CasB [Methanocorpusculum sp.]HJK29040.1 type I-E CRISPR-associated protein Cse2/CasB [Methanocorpusculum sp.]HJK30286.1 type I-E CRISPR-associated protein Cse2/CasB [Methanocorpusculum sp.]
MNEKMNRKMKIVCQWWELFHSDSNANFSKAGLAALHRCHSVSEVMFVPAFHQLVSMSRVEVTDTNTLYSLAVAAWVLSWVDENREVTFAEQIATSETPVRPVRFRRLLECSSWDELGMQLIRIVRLMKNTANVSDLSRGILFWMSGTWIQEQWALTYYANVLEEKKNS